MEAPWKGPGVEWLQSSDPGGGKVAGDAADTETVGPVRRHLDVEHSIAQTREARIARSNWRVLRQLDDPFVIIAEAKLVGRAQHAARSDVADHGLLQHSAGARNDGSRRRENAFHSGMRIGRATNHLNLSVSGFDKADLQPVGIWVAFRRNNRSHGERLETRRAVFGPFDLMAEHGQPVGYHLRQHIGFKMFFEPAEGRFHAAAPAGRGPRTSEGTSRGTKP